MHSQRQPSPQSDARAELLQERARLQADIDALKAENKELRRCLVLGDMKVGGAQIQLACAYV